MKSHIKKKWVEALRSGEYKQVRKKLWDEEKDTYCCLGVLTDLYCKEKKMKEKKKKKVFHNNVILPDAVYLWAGTNFHNPVVIVNHRNKIYEMTLGGCNDGSLILNGKSMSFTEIADLIEEQL